MGTVPAESGSLMTGMLKRVGFLASLCHTQSSLWPHKMRTCSGSHRVVLLILTTQRGGSVWATSRLAASRLHALTAVVDK